MSAARQALPLTGAGTTERLAHFAVATKFDDLPESVVHAARRSMVDSIGVMVAGSSHPAVETLVATLTGTADGGHLVVARDETLDIVNATVVNGVMAHVLDFDDTILPTRCHISAPLVPALLAASETESETAVVRGSDALA